MRKPIFNEKFYHLELTPSKLAFHKWEEVKHQLSIMKQTASQMQKSKCVGGFVGLHLSFKLLYKVIVICKSFFQNHAVVSYSIGEEMLILSFEAITTACLVFVFANTFSVVTHCNIFTTPWYCSSILGYNMTRHMLWLLGSHSLLGLMYE